MTFLETNSKQVIMSKVLTKNRQKNYSSVESLIEYVVNNMPQKYIMSIFLIWLPTNTFPFITFSSFQINYRHNIYPKIKPFTHYDKFSLINKCKQSYYNFLYILDHTPEKKLVNQGFKNMEWNRVLKNRS